MAIYSEKWINLPLFLQTLEGQKNVKFEKLVLEIVNKPKPTPDAYRIHENGNLMVLHQVVI